MKNNKQIQSLMQGFTLIELLVTLAVTSAIMLFGAPAFFDQIKRERLISESYSMLNYMQSAQEVAVSSGRVVAILPEKAKVAGNSDGEYWNQPLVMTFVPEELLEKEEDLSVEKVRNAIDSPAGQRLRIAKHVIFTLPKDTSLKIENLTFAGNRLALGNAIGNYMLFLPDGVTAPGLFYVNEARGGETVTHAIVGDCVSSPYSLGIKTFNPPKKDPNATCDWML